METSICQLSFSQDKFRTTELLDKTNEKSNQNQLLKTLNVNYKAATFCLTFERSVNFFLTQQNRNKGLKYDWRDLRDKVARLKKCKYHVYLIFTDYNKHVSQPGQVKLGFAVSSTLWSEYEASLSHKLMWETVLSQWVGILEGDENFEQPT